MNSVARVVVGILAGLALGAAVAPAPATFVTYNGTLFCGTTKAVYSWNGSSWVKDGSFPAHDVRSLASVNGELWAATFDAGIFHKTPSGWTAGLGLEWAFFGGNFTAFAEYDYASFGTTRVNYTAVAAPGFTFPLDVRQSVNLFLFGINYRFGPAGGY